MTFRAHKVVSQLPSQLEANAIYAVRVGEGFDLYISDSTGAMAHKVNPKLTWDHLVFWPSSDAGTATVSGTSGFVSSHTKSGQTYFRFRPEPYSAALDGFYTTFTGGVLSGLVVTRG